MSRGDLYKTLRKALGDMTFTEGAITMFGEATDFETEEISTTFWFQVFFLPAGKLSLMKESDGMDELVGIMQVSVFTNDINDGDARILAVVDEIEAEFVHGKTYDHFADVFIENTDIGPIRVDGGYLRVDASVNWTAYVER